MYFLDTETCGLYGMPVLLQYAIDDGPIVLHHIWKVPMSQTLKLIDDIALDMTGFVGFNLTFDWFQLVKIYTTFQTAIDNGLDPETIPQEMIPVLANYEYMARDAKCLKPVKACDLLMYARKGPFQSTMEREDIRIKRIPVSLAEPLADELEQRIPFSDIYFARRKNKDGRRWKVMDIHDPDTKEIDPDFKDIVLSFAPSAALKVLAVEALGYDKEQVILHGDIEVPEIYHPVELGYAPFALAIGNSKDWKLSWPDMIRFHIDHWYYNEKAQQYASDDIKYTRGLWKYFGSPEPGDDDSTLTCMVAACRWSGYKIDVEGIKEAKKEAELRAQLAPRAPQQAKNFIAQHMSPDELTAWSMDNAGSTKKTVLQSLTKWKADGPNGEEIPHPAAVAADAILNARMAEKEVELYDKLIVAGRLHASLNVIGTLSGRMSGTDKLNVQGIKRTKAVRSLFKLAFNHQTLCGGDFDAFEVAIMIAVYNDPKLIRDLMTCSECGHSVPVEVYLEPKPKCPCCGTVDSLMKIHGLFAMKLFPGMTYKEIVATKDTKDDRYNKGKQGVFAIGYGGNEDTLEDRLNIDSETAQLAYESFLEEYTQIAENRKKVVKRFCSMVQPNGIGSKVEWHEPDDFIESLFGFKRYFTLENRVCKVLYNLAQEPPAAWTKINIKVKRRERIQTASGAVRSALFASAFGIQSGNMRAAANHEIQSTGAQATKMLQRRIWDLQPPGYEQFFVKPLNVHDEVMCPTEPRIIATVEAVVKQMITELRSTIPLVKMVWKSGLSSWAGK